MQSVRKFPFVAVALAGIILPLISCKKHFAPSSTEPNVVRISSVKEPPELLVPGEKPAVHTPELDAFAKAIENIKGGNEAAALPALNDFIRKYPNMADAYSMRGTIRCTTGDLQGARADVEKALTEPHRLLLSDAESDRAELLAFRAKLAYIGHDDATTGRDLHTMVESYSSNLQYLTDGRVKLTDKPNSVCAWSSDDVADWLKRSNASIDAQVFRIMFVSSFAPLDDDAKELTQRYAADLVSANPSFAAAYFYAAVGEQKVAAYKSLAFSDAERADYTTGLIALWSKVIELNPFIEKAFAERADNYLERKDYSAAISDYDRAIALSPEDPALWNDRGLAKQETYDKAAAISDFTQAIMLKTKREDFRALTYSLDNRADLYAKMGDYKQALEDCNSLIGVRMHDFSVFMNLDFFRKLYPEYAGVDDTTLKNKLHRMLVPNFSDETFDQTIMDPKGLHPTIDGGLREAYLKRADILLALKQFTDAQTDYARSQLFSDRTNNDRWRTLPALEGIALDLQTLDTEQPSHIDVWMKPAESNDQVAEPQPTRFDLDCQHHTIRMGEQGTASEPKPGTYAEIVRDFFCSPAR